MENTQKKGNLLLGIIVLVALIAAVAVLGIIFSKPKEALVTGEAQAAEYRIPERSLDVSRLSMPLRVT